jgi:hypothetical protein
LTIPQNEVERIFNERNSSTILVLDVTMDAALIDISLKGIDLAATTLKSRSAKQTLEVILMGSEGSRGNVVYDTKKGEFMEELEKKVAKAIKAEKSEANGKSDFVSASNEISHLIDEDQSLLSIFITDKKEVTPLLTTQTKEFVKECI